MCIICHLQLCFSIDRIRLIYGHKQISMTSYGFEYSLTWLDEINSLLHVALHSVTVTNCSKDQLIHGPVIAVTHVVTVVTPQ